MNEILTSLFVDKYPSTVASVLQFACGIHKTFDISMLLADVNMFDSFTRKFSDLYFDKNMFSCLRARREDFRMRRFDTSPTF